MTLNNLVRVFFLLAACCLFSAAFGQEQASKGQAARPEVGKPLQSAIELLKAKKAKEALAKAREAQSVPNKTPYETYMVTRVIAQAAAGAGEPGVAAKAFDEASG